MDQNRLPGLESGGVDQRLPCCGGSKRNCGGLLKADPFRFSRGFVFLRDGKLGVSALLTKTEISVNRIARFEFGNLGADFLHHPGHIETRDEWKVFAPKTTGPNRSIDRIHGCSHRADQNFIVLWFRPRRVFIFQHLGPTIFVNDNCFHHRRSRLSKDRSRHHRTQSNAKQRETFHNPFSLVSSWEQCRPIVITWRLSIPRQTQSCRVAAVSCSWITIIPNICRYFHGRCSSASPVGTKAGTRWYRRKLLRSSAGAVSSDTRNVKADSYIILLTSDFLVTFDRMK